MKTVRPLLLILQLLLCAFAAGAQGAYLDKGVNGIGGEARVVLGLDGVEGFGIVSGYSIAGILDVGGNFGVTYGTLGGYDSTDLRMALDYRINVIKQTAGLPLSLQIMGSYGLNNVLSEYLDNDSATRRGTGYTLGLNLASNMRLTPSWLIRVSLLGEYASKTYTTKGNILNITGERVGNLYLGGALGFLFMFPSCTILVVQAELRADKDLALQINPIVSVAFPQR